MTTTANNTTNENNDNKRPECADYTREQVEALLQTEEYKAFSDEFRKRTNDLIEFVGAHTDRYNCGFLISVVTLNAADDFCSGVAVAGTKDTIVHACARLLEDDTTGPIMKATVVASLLKP